MTFLSLLFTGLLSSQSLWAALPLDDAFKKLLHKNKVGPITEQAYCFEQDGQIQGLHFSRPQRIASVSKLFTTLLVSETMDLNKRYETTLTIKGNDLHIEGSGDPYFESEKLLLLIQALNQLGHKSFDRISFDRNFLFYDLDLGAFEEITSEEIKKRLSLYLDGKRHQAAWSKVVHFAREEGVRLDTHEVPSLKAKSITILNENPLEGSGTQRYTHTSRPLHAILKAMNVMSKNVVAQNLYAEASRIKKISTLFSEKGVSLKNLEFHTGSGLPIIRGPQRTDNLATCTTVLKVIDHLEESLLRQGLKMSDVIAVGGGIDFGTFRHRFASHPELSEAILSKTGTLVNASALAGVLLLDTTVPFAILNHTTAASHARSFQDEFLSVLFHSIGEPSPIPYEKISIFPWDNSPFFD